MKRNIVLAAIMSLFVLAVAASAQKAPDFSGTWNLDVSKSKLDANARIESMTLTVVQTATDVKATYATKRTPPPTPPAGAPAGGGQGSGRGGGGGDTTNTYTLDGKPTVVQQETRGGTVPVTFTAAWDSSALNLTSSRTFTPPNGDAAVTSTTKENWSLSSDGTLTIKRDTTGMRASSSTFVFTKNK